MKYKNLFLMFTFLLITGVVYAQCEKRYGYDFNLKEVTLEEAVFFSAFSKKSASSIDTLTFFSKECVKVMDVVFEKNNPVFFIQHAPEKEIKKMTILVMSDANSGLVVEETISFTVKKFGTVAYNHDGLQESYQLDMDKYRSLVSNYKYINKPAGNSGSRTNELVIIEFIVLEDGRYFGYDLSYYGRELTPDAKKQAAIFAKAVVSELTITPGKINGKPVATVLSLPISFKYQ